MKGKSYVGTSTEQMAIKLKLSEMHAKLVTNVNVEFSKTVANNLLELIEN